MFLIRYILLVLVFSGSTSARMYWVFFEEDVTRPQVQLTDKARARLASRGSPTIQGDRAVSTIHIDQLIEAGFETRTVSRFLNAVSMDIENREQLEYINNLSFVTSTQPVASSSKRITLEASHTASLSKSWDHSYGLSYTQNQILNIPQLHAYGYDGSGVLIAVFDTGFNLGHSTFDNIHVVDGYDFVDHDNDPYRDGADEHGTQVLSVMGGYSSGNLIGPAYGASFLLARTEDVYSETRVEEDNWVAALEWADSLGVDIISASLNYRDFDGTLEDYAYEDVDGKTAIVTRAANIAATRGILVVNSMGNSGPGDGSVWPPADSPHVLGIGAISASGIIASFSSRGPTYDGRIKPDVVAMGSTVHMMRGLDEYRTGSGTSYATPLVAGLAALLLQSHSELKPDSIITIFRQNGDNSDSPNNTYGWGVPKLLNYFDSVEVNDSTISVESLPSIQSLVFPNPSIGNTLNILLPEPAARLIETIDIYDLLGRHITRLELAASSAFVLRGTLPTDTKLADQLYVIMLVANGKHYIGKFIHINP